MNNNQLPLLPYNSVKSYPVGAIKAQTKVQTTDAISRDPTHDPKISYM